MAVRRKASIKTVGIVIRPNSQRVAQRAKKVAQWFTRRGVTVLAHGGWATAKGAVRVVEPVRIMRDADLVVVLGGDGSLLGVARLSGPRPVPILGIHHGGFGFLARLRSNEVFGAFIYPNALAGYLAILIPVHLACVWPLLTRPRQVSSLSPRFLHIALLSVECVALLLTGSKGQQGRLESRQIRLKTQQ